MKNRLKLHEIAALTLIFLGSSQLYSVTYSWNGGGSDNNYNTGLNWLGGTVPGSSDVGEFNSPSISNTKTAIDVTFVDSVQSLDFKNGSLLDQSFTFTIHNTGALIMLGGGMSNDSHLAQKFIIQSGGYIDFKNSAAAAGILSTNELVNYELQGGTIYFDDTSSAGTGSLQYGIFTDSGSSGSLIRFNGLSGTNAQAGFGHFTLDRTDLQFLQSSNANNAVITMTNPAGQSSILFGNSSSADSANISLSTNTGLTFTDTATAASSTINANNSDITFESNSVGGSSVITLTNGSTLNINAPTSIGRLLTGDLSPNLSTVNLNGFFLGIGTVNSNSTSNAKFQNGGGIIKLGTGILTLSGSNTYTAGTMIEQGSVSVSDSSNLGTGTITFQPESSNTSSTLTFNTPAGLTTFTNPVMINSAFTANLNVVSATSNVALTGAIQGGGVLAANGLGTLTLSGNSTYSGGTQINSGTVSVGADTNLGTGNISIAATGTLSATGSFSTSKLMALTTGSIIDVASGETLSVSGVVSGGLLTKQGLGVLALGGVNTYTGGTTITSGTVSVFQDTNLGTGNISIGASGILQSTGTFATTKTISLSAGSTIDVTSGENLTANGILSGSSLTKTGLGTLTLGVSNSYTGGTFLNGGTISVSTNAQLGVGGGLTFNGGTLEFSAPVSTARTVSLLGSGTIQTDVGTSTLSGVVSGIGNLIKTGPGTLILSNTNLYSGGTTISNGVLSVAANANLGTGNIAIGSTGTLLTTATFATSKGIALSLGSTIDVTAGTTLTANGIISGVGGSLTKIDTGTLVLTGANTYDSGTTITGGIVSVSQDNNLGTGNIAIGAAGTLRATGTFTTSKQTSLALGSTIDVTAANTLTMNGVVSGVGGSLTKTSAGTLILGGANTYDSGTTITGGVVSVSQDNNLGTGNISIGAAGTLQSTGTFATSKLVSLANGSQIGVSSGQNLTLNGVVSGVGSSLIKIDTGTLTLGAVNTYSGGTTITGGTVSVSQDANLGSGNISIGAAGTLQSTGTFATSKLVFLAAGSTIDVTSGQNLTLNGVVSGASLTKTNSGILTLGAVNTYAGGTTITGGTVSVSQNTNLGTGNIAIGAAGILQSTGTFATSKLISLGLGSSIDVTSGNTLTANGVISGVGGSLTKLDSGTLVLNAVNTYDSGTFFNGGIVSVSNDNNLGSTVGQLTFNGGTLELTSAITSGRTINLNTTGTVLTDIGTSTFSGPIMGSGSLIKGGSGTLALTNASNSYAGGTTIDAGVLQVAGDAYLGSPTGGITFNGGTLEFTAATTSARSILLNAAGTIQADAEVTLNGQITGSGSLIKTGVGSLALMNLSNSYLGGTTIAQGVLQALGDGSLGASAGGLTMDNLTTLEILNGASFNSTRSVTLNGISTIQTDAGSGTSTFSGVISGSGSLIKTGPDTLVLNGINTYQSGTTINDGILKISSNGALGLGTSHLNFNGGSLEVSASTNFNGRPFVLNSSGTLITDPGTTVTIPTGITGSGNFTKTGTGILNLTGANTYTGNTTVALGSMYVDGSLNSSTTTTVLAGALLGGNGTVGNLNVYGTLSPGHISAGTLHAHNVELFPGSTFNAYLNGLSNNQLNASGSVTIDSSSTLVVDPRLATGTQYPIILGSSVTGTFSPVINIYPRYFVQANYFPQEVILFVIGSIPFPDIIPKGDLNRIATCFQTMIDSDLSPDMITILKVLDSLTLPEMINAFDQFDPGFFNAIGFAEESFCQRVREVYTAHAYSLRRESIFDSEDWTKGIRLWSTLLFNHSRQNNTGISRAFSGYKDYFSGFVSGFDYLVNPQLLVSTGFGYARDRLDWLNVDAKAGFNNYNGTLSAAYSLDRFIFDSSFGWTYSDVNVARRIFIEANESMPAPLAPIDRKLSHNNSLNAFNAHIGGAYDYFYTWSVPLQFFLRPFFNLDYTFIHSGSFVENGGDSLDLAVDAKEYDLLRPELGIACRIVLDYFFLYTLDFELSYVRENRFLGQGTRASFANSQGCLFDVDGLFFSRNLISPVVQLEICSMDRIQFEAEYRGLFGAGYSENEVRFELRVCW